MGAVMQSAALGIVAVLCGIAALLARRRAKTPRMLEVIESLSLGNRRALVVAKMNGELLVLGSSEAGVALLTTRPEQAKRPFEAMLDDTVEEDSLRRKLSRKVAQ